MSPIPRALIQPTASGLACLLLSAGAALAQPGRSAVAAALADSTATPAPGARDGAPPDSTQALSEQVRALTAEVDKLKRFKFSGYVQVRWESAEDQADTVKVGGPPLAYTLYNRQSFSIRRARLKLHYVHGPLTDALVYFNAGNNRSVQLLEAYLTLRDPWTADHRHALTVGQFNVPFGYEIERSSSAREVPERSRAENVLFPGERDRGIKLVSRWLPRLETVVGLLNGQPIGVAGLGGNDPTGGKDGIARARWRGGAVAVAASGYLGRDVVPLTGGEVEFDKTRYGLDAQGSWELSRLGGGMLCGELYAGHNANADSIAALVESPAGDEAGRSLRPGADPAHLATDFRGGYVMAVQSFGEWLQAAARYDRWDPNVDVDHDEFERVNVALNALYDRNMRLTVSYEWLLTEKLVAGRYVDPADNLWTVQFQYKF